MTLTKIERSIVEKVGGQASMSQLKDNMKDFLARYRWQWDSNEQMQKELATEIKAMEGILAKTQGDLNFKDKEQST